MLVLDSLIIFLPIFKIAQADMVYFNWFILGFSYYLGTRI